MLSLAQFLQHSYAETNTFFSFLKVLWLLLAETGLPALGSGPAGDSQAGFFLYRPCTRARGIKKLNVFLV